MHERRDVNRMRKNAAFADVDSPAVAEVVDWTVPRAMWFGLFRALAAKPADSPPDQPAIRIIDDPLDLVPPLTQARVVKVDDVFVFYRFLTTTEDFSNRCCINLFALLDLTDTRQV